MAEVDYVVTIAARPGLSGSERSSVTEALQAGGLQVIREEAAGPTLVTSARRPLWSVQIRAANLAEAVERASARLRDAFREVDPDAEPILVRASWHGESF
jgi:hypothetical protein